MHAWNSNIKHDPLEPQSVDMWSLGLIAFTILSGKHPFFRKGDMAKMALRIVAGDFEFRPEDWTNISEHARVSRAAPSKERENNHCFR